MRASTQCSTVCDSTDSVSMILTSVLRSEWHRIRRGSRYGWISPSKGHDDRSAYSSVDTMHNNQNGVKAVHYVSMHTLGDPGRVQVGLANHS